MMLFGPTGGKIDPGIRPPRIVGGELEIVRLANSQVPAPVPEMLKLARDVLAREGLAGLIVSLQSGMLSRAYIMIWRQGFSAEVAAALRQLYGERHV